MWVAMLATEWGFKLARLRGLGKRVGCRYWSAQRRNEIIYPRSSLLTTTQAKAESRKGYKRNKVDTNISLGARPRESARSGRR